MLSIKKYHGKLMCFKLTDGYAAVYYCKIIHFIYTGHTRHILVAH